MALRMKEPEGRGWWDEMSRTRVDCNCESQVFPTFQAKQKEQSPTTSNWVLLGLRESSRSAAWATRALLFSVIEVRVVATSPEADVLVSSA